jgi:hypothetical protein
MRTAGAGGRSVTRGEAARVFAERAGLLRGLRAGRQRIWELETRRLAEARTYLETISRQWDQALERLRAFVEG